LADLDGDGDYDLMRGTTAGDVVAYENTGDVSSPMWGIKSAWGIADPNPGSANFAGVELGDLNGDGKPDLLYGDVQGVTSAYQNTGPYSTPGTYTSKVVDAGTHGGFTTLAYTAVIPTGTTLTVDIRAGDDLVGLVTADPGTGADGSFNSSTYNGSSIVGITGTSPSLTINTDNAPVTIASGDATYPLGAGIFNFTDFTLASGDTLTVTGSKALVIRTNTGNVTIAGTLNASASANGAAGPGGYNGGLGAAVGSGPGGGQHYSTYGEGSGGGYGGAGGAATSITGGVAYGTSDLSVFYGGSGGGGCKATGGELYGGGGGGAVKIESSADIVVSGSILAIGFAGGHCVSSNGNTNAENGSGGGAGGAVYLSGNNVSVAGTVNASGGMGGNAVVRNSGGGGGGGRVYVRGASSVDVAGVITENGAAGGTPSTYGGSPGAAGSYFVPVVPLVFNTPPTGTWTPWLTGITNGGDISSLGTKRYVQYRFNLTTSDTAVSPALFNIQANVQPPAPTPIPVSVATGSGSGGGALSAMDLLMLGLFVLYAQGRKVGLGAAPALAAKEILNPPSFRAQRSGDPESSGFE